MILCFLILSLTADTKSVALVLKSQGEITLVRGDAKPVRLWEQDLLHVGDKLDIPDGGEAILVVLFDGHRETLRPGKGIVVGEKGCPGAVAIPNKLPGKILDDLAEELRGGRLGGVLLRTKPGDHSPFVSPLPGAKLLNDRPTFRWPDVRADRYVVEVYLGAAGKDPQLLWRIETTKNELPYPKDEKPLTPLTHCWSVVAKDKDGGEKALVTLREGRFSVANEATRKNLDALKSLAESKDSTDLLLAAYAYETAVALEEAMAIHQKLVELRPKEPRHLETLANFYERGGQPSRARELRAKAHALRESPR